MVQECSLGDKNLAASFRVLGNARSWTLLVLESMTCAYTAKYS